MWRPATPCGLPGRSTPKVALFYDTSTLVHNKAGRQVDLTTDDGKAWFYCTIRDFWSFIPPRHWAAIDGKPIILLYAVNFAKKQDATLFPYVRARFQKDFGVDPYIIKQTSWAGEADNTCNWGVRWDCPWQAVRRLVRATTTRLCPGARRWCASARVEPSTREAGRLSCAINRRDGHGSSWWRPGTSFTRARMSRHSQEYGRQYIDLTRKFADMFHANAVTAGISGPYQNAKSVASTFGEGGKDGGIRVETGGDGITKATVVADRPCVQSAPSEHAGKYMYFSLDDSFAFDLDPQTITVVVEYYDGGPAGFALEYDSGDTQGSVRDGAFKQAAPCRSATRTPGRRRP